MNFASDNAAGIAPEIFAAIARANQGAALAYGRDHWTGRIEQRFARIEALLMEHNRILQALPDAIREKTGFNAPVQVIWDWPASTARV